VSTKRHEAQQFMDGVVSTTSHEDLKSAKPAAEADACEATKEVVPLSGMWQSVYNGSVLTSTDGIVLCSDGWIGHMTRCGSEVTITYEWSKTSTFGMLADGALDISPGPGALWQPLAGARAESLSPGGRRRQSRIAQLLERGCLALVKGSYLEDCHERGTPFDMRQKIPEHYVWNAEEAIGQWVLYGKTFLYIVSYSWLTSNHPDPDLYHLKRLACILKKLKRHYSRFGVREIAVAIDYCSLWQRQREGTVEDFRTPEQHKQFSEGLGGFNDMYADRDVTALKISSVPVGEPRGYKDRGWPLAETALINCKPTMKTKFTFDENFDHDLEAREGNEFVNHFTACLAVPPMTPAALDVNMQDRRERAGVRGLDLFTKGPDNKLVPQKYKESFAVVVKEKTLTFPSVLWSGPEIISLCQVLPLFTSLEYLGLAKNRIDGKALEMLCQTLKFLPSFKFLNIRCNLVGIDEVACVTRSFTCMPSLVSLSLSENPVCSSAALIEELNCEWAQAGKEPHMLLTKGW